MLGPLGLDAVAATDPPFAEWGDFAIFADGAPLSANVHVAFAAASREQVEAFHASGLSAGFTDNGAPGERAHYHPRLLRTFLLDPDGDTIEAVFHDR